MTLSDALLAALIALIGGLLVAVLASFLQGRADRARWLRDKRLALYSGIVEKLARLDEATLRLINSIRGKNAVRTEELEDVVRDIARIERELSDIVMPQVNVLASRRMREVTDKLVGNLDIELWYRRYDKPQVTFEDLPPSWSMLSYEDIERYAEAARRDIGAESVRDRLVGWFSLRAAHYRYRASQALRRLRGETEGPRRPLP